MVEGQLRPKCRVRAFRAAPQSSARRRSRVCAPSAISVRAEQAVMHEVVGRAGRTDLEIARFARGDVMQRAATSRHRGRQHETRRRSNASPATSERPCVIEPACSERAFARAYRFCAGVGDGGRARRAGGGARPSAARWCRRCRASATRLGVVRAASHRRCCFGLSGRESRGRRSATRSQCADGVGYAVGRRRRRGGDVLVGDRRGRSRSRCKIRVSSIVWPASCSGVMMIPANCRPNEGWRLPTVLQHGDEMVAGLEFISSKAATSARFWRTTPGR